MTRDSDEQNYRRFLDGDNQGFENLVLEYKDSLIYFINRYVHDLYLAEDLAQDAFVEIYVHKERFRFLVGFKTYLFSIGKHKTIDYIRKYGRIIPVEECLWEAEEQGLEEKLIEKEDKRQLYQTIKQLKPDYQAALYLIDYERQSYAETAKILHKTEGQIKILIYRARKALAKQLKKTGEFL